MRTTRNTVLTGLVLAAGLASVGSLFAQQNAKDSSGMDGQMMGGMHGNMMSQMSDMMEKCNAMMDGMQDKHKQQDG